MCSILKNLCCRIKALKKNHASDNYLKEFQHLKQTVQKPCCSSCCLPVIALILVPVTLLIPLKCSGDRYVVDAVTEKHLSISQSGDTTKNNSIETLDNKADTIFALQQNMAIQDNRNDWLLSLYCLLAAIIILIATLLCVKLLVPYWLKIAELNDKQVDRLTRMAEDRLDFERLPRRTEITILEKQAKVNMEKELKANQCNQQQ